MANARRENYTLPPEMDDATLPKDVILEVAKTHVFKSLGRTLKDTVLNAAATCIENGNALPSLPPPITAKKIFLAIWLYIDVPAEGFDTCFVEAPNREDQLPPQFANDRNRLDVAMRISNARLLNLKREQLEEALRRLYNDVTFRMERNATHPFVAVHIVDAAESLFLGGSTSNNQ